MNQRLAVLDIVLFPLDEQDFKEALLFVNKSLAGCKAKKL
jgi:hypothetical protein